MQIYGTTQQLLRVLSTHWCTNKVVATSQTTFSNAFHWRQVPPFASNFVISLRHIYVGKLIIIGSDNGLSPDRRQAIIWTNALSLSIWPLQTYFNEYLIKIQQFPLRKMHVKMSSVKWRPSGLGLNLLMFVPWCPMGNKSALVQVMTYADQEFYTTWRR